MNSGNPSGFILSLPTLRTWLTWLAIFWLLGLIGLGWLVKSFLILVALLMLAPVLLLIGFRWWVKRNVLQAPCPVCQTELVGLKKATTQCPNCGTPLQVAKDQFQRLSAPGTIDVDAVDVSVQVLED